MPAPGGFGLARFALRHGDADKFPEPSRLRWRDNASGAEKNRVKSSRVSKKNWPNVSIVEIIIKIVKREQVLSDILNNASTLKAIMVP